MEEYVVFERVSECCDAYRSTRQRGGCLVNGAGDGVEVVVGRGRCGVTIGVRVVVVGCAVLRN